MFFRKKERNSFFTDQALKNQVSGMFLEFKIGMHLRFMILLLLSSRMISVLILFRKKREIVFLEIKL